MYKISLICEGPSDYAILEAILDHYFDDYELVMIQPPISALGGKSGPFGGGWKGIRTWCQQEGAQAGGLATILQNSDLVVVQVDADVATETEFHLEWSCPPVASVTQPVRSMILNWLQLAQCLERLVLCVPALATETWALVSLFPDHEPETEIQCQSDIKQRLRILAKEFSTKLVTAKKRSLKNDASGYRKIRQRLTAGWPRVLQRCSEAQSFSAELQRHQPLGSSAKTRAKRRP